MEEFSTHFHVVLVVGEKKGGEGMWEAAFLSSLKETEQRSKGKSAHHLSFFSFPFPFSFVLCYDGDNSNGKRGRDGMSRRG